MSALLRHSNKNDNALRGCPGAGRSSVIRGVAARLDRRRAFYGLLIVTWVRLDQDCCDHPKVDEISNGAFRLWISAKCWANRFWTDGYIDPTKLAKISPRTRRHSAAAAELVRARLWHSHDDLTCDSPHCPVNLGVEARRGFIIHDFLQYQPSSVKLKRLSENRAESGRRGGLAKAKQSASGESYPDPSRSVPARPDPKRERESGSNPSISTIEQQGFKQLGQLGGSSIVAMRQLMPITQSEMDDALKTPAKGWKYLAKVIISQREQAANQPPEGSEWEAARAKEDKRNKKRRPPAEPKPPYHQLADPSKYDP